MAKKKNLKKSSNKQNQTIKSFGFFWALILIMGVMYVTTKDGMQNTNLPYNHMKELVKSGKVSKINLKGKNINGTFNQEEELTINGQQVKTKVFKTILPIIDDPAFMPLLDNTHVEINVEEEGEGLFTVLLINLLPWILIIGFFYYSSKKLSKNMNPFGGKGGFPFNSVAKKFVKDKSSLSFKDVAGSENPKRDLLDIIDFLKNPQKFNTIGATLPKGVLLMGPPGTGKTLLAKATAGEANVPFFSMSGSEFIEIFVGVGASRVRDLFKNAKKEAPSIIFIDEIDAIGRARGTGLGGGHDEREQTLNQILSEMDGFEKSMPIVVMAATNRPDVLDPALIRPGRFDRQITIDLPHKEAREAIIKVHLAKVKSNGAIDTLSLAKSTVGFSGADLRNLVNEAALLAARNGKTEVSSEDFDNARDKVLMGERREDRFTKEDKNIVAFHESGHAVVAYFTKGGDSLQKITIIPRGRALGYTEQLPENERFNPTKSYLEGQLAILLGGRLAEELIFEDITTGAEDDLKRATKLARKMVANYGMSDALGLVSFQKGEEHRFLGKEIAHDRDFSEKTSELIDSEIHKLIEEKRNYVRALLKEKKSLLENLATNLLEKETLGKEDIIKILGKTDNHLQHP